MSGAGAIACLKCNAGKITEMEGSNRCSDCSPGLYQSEKGKAECKDCPKGYARGRHVNVGSSCSKVKTITKKSRNESVYAWYGCSWCFYSSSLSFGTICYHLVSPLYLQNTPKQVFFFLTL